MRSRHPDPRLISVDLRSQQFGYAIFDGPDRLIDYGGGQLRPGGDAGAVLAGRRLTQLFKLFAPSTIAVKRPDRRVVKSRPAIRAMVKATRQVADMHLVVHCLIGRKEIRAAFRARSKYEIAISLTRIFPELLSKLPQKRKLGDPEHPRMVLFDAISVGFAYWQRNEMQKPPSDV